MQSLVDEADGIRLDAGFSGSEEALMTYNDFDLKIEINMSNNVHTLDTIMGYWPNQHLLVGCHNFYPHRYTGLGVNFFKACTDRFNRHGIRTAAFITSQNATTYGSCPVTDGLSTLEVHRVLPREVQYKHFLAMEIVDNIIISNCFPTETEMRKIGQLNKHLVTFDVDPVADLPATEREILFDTLHFNREDINDYVIRSTQSRVKFKGHEFPVFNAPTKIKRGDIIIESSEYGHYAGEVQIALKDMKNSGKSNVVGRIREEEIFILNEIKLWQKFRLQEAE